MSEKIGKFQILGELGKGAHSTIMQIRRAADGKQYALKMVPIDEPEDEKYLEQAKHEFRVAQMLDHPNLIKIYALETQTTWMFKVKKAQLLIEYVNGKTLDTFPRALPIPMLVQVFVHVASALVHMHRRGVYHADLKPNNILLSKTGEVKVFDYGLSWIKGENKDRVQGTPEYLAPETAKHGLINERTDMYNFGATMYRLVTWHFPPKATELLALKPKAADKLVKPVHEHNPRTPPTLCDLIHRCISFHAPSRPERMSEIQGTLDHLADDLVKTPEDKLEAMEW